MRTKARLGLLAVSIAVVLSACAGTTTPGAPPSGVAPQVPQAQAPVATKRIVAAIRGTTPVLYRKLAVGASYSGLEYLERLVNAGLVTVDEKGALHPQLAEAVPTVENGLWKVFPDGRMETVWKLRPTARWQYLEVLFRTTPFMKACICP